MPIGALLPLVELRASIVDAQRDLDDRDDVPAARRRILTLIQSRELFRTVVAQNTQRYGEAIDDVSERAKNELRVLRTLRPLKLVNKSAAERGPVARERGCCSSLIL